MNQALHPTMFAALAPFITPQRNLFAETSCSQCGIDLGPGNSGTSHCARHKVNTRPKGMPLPTDRELIALVSTATGMTAWEAHGLLSSFDCDGVADELVVEDRFAS